MAGKEKTKKTFNLLEMVPVCTAEHEITGDGRVNIRIPKFRNEKFARWFIPGHKSLYHTLHLDDQGSEVWKTIDGKLNVNEICTKINKPGSDNIHDRVSRFISQLYQAKCIAFRELNES